MSLFKKFRAKRLLRKLQSAKRFDEFYYYKVRAARTTKELHYYKEKIAEFEKKLEKELES